MLAKALQSAAGNAAEATYIEDVFSTYLYTGNGSTQTITNGIDLATEGGLVWLKARSAPYANELYDTVRGAGNLLESQSTNAAYQFSPVNSGGVSAFGATGFTLGSRQDANNNGTTFTSWTFRKAEKFFDVVTWSGNGTSQTINHNLGSVPGFIIIKKTNSAEDWWCFHRYDFTYRTKLNATNAAVNTTSVKYLGNNVIDVAPTSTTFTVGDTGGLNGSGDTFVAYLFAHDAGGFGDDGSENVISCGSYNDTTATTVNLGYEPQWILIKRTDSVGTWAVLNNMSGWTVQATANTNYLKPNATDNEQVSTWLYPTSTGFTTNGFGGTYIYIAIRRPMKPPSAGTEVFSPNTIGAVSVGTPVTTGFPVDLQIPTWRGGVSGHYVYDRLRGVSSSTTEGAKSLQTQSTSAEATVSTATRMWGNTGFQVDTSWSNSVSIFWNFRRAPGFMDVVCRNGTGANATQAHNLTVSPELVITKKRSAVNEWYVTHSFTASGYQRQYLEQTAAASSHLYASNFVWTAQPTASSLFFSNNSNVNQSGQTFVDYLFATVPGVSKVNSYTGNGSSQTINCGFTGGARFVLIKRTDSAGNWTVFDSARGIVAGNDPALYLNSTAAEVTTADAVDTDSTGFVVNQESTLNLNVSSATYIFLAIA